MVQVDPIGPSSGVRIYSDAQRDGQLPGQQPPPVYQLYNNIMQDAYTGTLDPQIEAAERRLDAQLNPPQITGPVVPQAGTILEGHIDAAERILDQQLVAQGPQQQPPPDRNTELERRIEEAERRLDQQLPPLGPASGQPTQPGTPVQVGQPQQQQITVRPTPQQIEESHTAIAGAHGINRAARNADGSIIFNGGKAWLQLDGTIFVEGTPVADGLPGQVHGSYTLDGTGTTPQDFERYRRRTTPLEFTRLMGALRLQFTRAAAPAAPAAPGAPAAPPPLGTFTFTSSDPARAGSTFHFQQDGTFIGVGGPNDGKTFRLNPTTNALEEVRVPGPPPAAGAPAGPVAPVPRPMLPFTRVLAQVNAHPISNQDGSYTRVTNDARTNGQLVYIQVDAAGKRSLFVSQFGTILAMTLVPDPANANGNWIRSDDATIPEAQRFRGDRMLPATRNIGHLHLFLDHNNRLRQAGIVANTLDLNGDGSRDNPTHEGYFEIRGAAPNINPSSLYFNGGMFEGTTNGNATPQSIINHGEYNFEEYRRGNSLYRNDGRRVAATAPPAPRGGTTTTTSTTPTGTAPTTTVASTNGVAPLDANGLAVFIEQQLRDRGFQPGTREYAHAQRTLAQTAAFNYSEYGFLRNELNGYISENRSTIAADPLSSYIASRPIPSRELIPGYNMDLGSGQVILTPTTTTPPTTTAPPGGSPSTGSNPLSDIY